MDELLELIARIGGDDAPSSEELSVAREELVEHLRVATAKETRDLSAATAIRGAVDNIDTELTSRREQAEADEAEAARLLEGLAEPTDEVVEVETPAEENEAETPAETRERVPVAASVSPNLRRALSRTQARMRADIPESPDPGHRILTLGAAQSERLTSSAGMLDVARVFDRSAGRVKNGRQSLVRVEYDYPENRRLFGKESGDNDRLLDTMNVSPQLAAVSAAGGICDPLPADFSIPLIGQRGRPIRDALPRFQASRGGVRFSPSLSIAVVTGGVGTWTYETDVTPGGSTKACAVLNCEDESVAHVDAIYRCVEVGNMQARFNPEWWRNRLDLLAILHDRTAERHLYTDMVAAATPTTYSGNESIYSVLTAIDKAAAGLRSRLRLGSATIRVVLAEWIRDALRSQITRQVYAGAAPTDQYGTGLADGRINEFFTSRRVEPVWSQDLDLFSAQVSGGLQDWPGGTTDLLVYPEGTFFYLDGGTLDLGTEIVDSTLIQTNDRQAFMETFQKAVFRGGEALKVTVTVDEVCGCPA
jgi:hypothetical protein